MSTYIQTFKILVSCFIELQLHEEKSFAVMPTTATSRERSFVRDTARSWEPLDNLNMLYMEKLRDRDKAVASKNYIKDNMVLYLVKTLYTFQEFMPVL